MSKWKWKSTRRWWSLLLVIPVWKLWCMSRLMTKPTKWPVRPAKTQISLGIRPVWSEFAVRMKKALVFNYPLSAQWRLIGLGDVRLIWVFAGHICHFVGFVMRWLICCRPQNGMKSLGLTVAKKTIMSTSVSGVRWRRLIVTGNRWLQREKTVNSRCQTWWKDTMLPRKLDM